MLRATRKELQSMSSIKYMARNDFNKVGSNCNPFAVATAEWCDYEIEFQRIWAESQGITYAI